MQRFVLRFTGPGAAPAADVARIAAATGVSVIDASPRMVLVEASGMASCRLADELAGWICVPEQGVQLPDPRPRPRQAPPASGKRPSAVRGARGDRRGGRSKGRD